MTNAEARAAAALILLASVCDACVVQTRLALPRERDYDFVCDTSAGGFLHFKRGFSWAVRSGYLVSGCHRYVGFKGTPPLCRPGTHCAACVRPVGAVAVDTAYLEGNSCQLCTAPSTPPPAPAPPPPEGEAPIAITGGDEMPAVGFGTCCRASAKGSALITSTKAYLAQGGRLIDTAQMYENHRDLAVAIRESRVNRSDLWVTSKVNTRMIHSRLSTEHSIDASLRELGVQYVDAMLIHGTWGIGINQLVEVWRGLIDAQAAGKVRHLGVSNFVSSQIEHIEHETGVRPAVHQLEFHPWVPNSTFQLVRWCQAKGIAVTAYGSLGGSASSLSDSAVVAELAERHNVSSAQVLLRWALQQNVAVIPGATSDRHIRENLHLPPFVLAPAEMERIVQSSRPSSFTRWYNLEEEWGPISRMWERMYSAGALSIVALLAVLACCVLCCVKRNFQYLRGDDEQLRHEFAASVELASSREPPALGEERAGLALNTKPEAGGYRSAFSTPCGSPVAMSVPGLEMHDESGRV